MAQNECGDTKFGDSLRLFHDHRRQLREACDSIRQPLATANAFLSSALTEGSDQARADDVDEPRVQESAAFFTGIQETDEAISRLFKIGVTLSESDNNNRNPSIVVVGQTKAGKSSFINALLRGEYLCSMGLACTARLTHLTYGQTLRVRLRRPDGSVDPWTQIHGTKIPPDLVQLSPEERHNSELVNVIVEAEIPSDFLRKGIDIYDSPGRNENAKLRELTDQAFNSLVPMIVYVIDGLKQLTREDIADLDQIKRTHPTSNIFYVITKLDQPTTRRRGPSRGNTEEEHVQKTMEEIKRGLINRGCLPDGNVTPHFHGVSLLQLSEWRRRGEGANVKPPPLVQAFERLQEELFDFISNRLDSRVAAAALSLQQVS